MYTNGEVILTMGDVISWGIMRGEVILTMDEAILWWMQLYWLWVRLYYEGWGYIDEGWGYIDIGIHTPISAWKLYQDNQLLTLQYKFPKYPILLSALNAPTWN